MAVTASDFLLRLAANHPEDDTATVGGAADATGQVLHAQFAAAARPEIDSTSASDTMNVTITGRLASGAISAETKAAAGTTAVLFDTEFVRIMKIELATPATGTITVAEGTGGTVRHTFPPGDDLARILFYGASAEPTGGAAETRYEKVFVENSHATDAAIGVTVEVTTNPRDDYNIIMEDAADDTNTAANRETEPTGNTGSFGVGPLTIPGSDLDAGERQGVWIRQVLADGTTPGVDATVLTVAFVAAIA